MAIKAIKTPTEALADSTLKVPTVKMMVTPSVQIPEAPKLGFDPKVLAQVGALQKHLRDLAIQQPNWMTELAEASRRMSEQWKQLRAGVEEIATKHRSWFTELARASDECRKIEASGWLPHYTTPFAELGTFEGTSGTRYPSRRLLPRQLVERRSSIPQASRRLRPE